MYFKIRWKNNYDLIYRPNKSNKLVLFYLNDKKKSIENCFSKKGQTTISIPIILDIKGQENSPDQFELT